MNGLLPLLLRFTCLKPVAFFSARSSVSPSAAAAACASTAVIGAGCGRLQGLCRFCSAPPRRHRVRGGVRRRAPPPPPSRSGRGCVAPAVLQVRHGTACWRCCAAHALEARRLSARSSASPPLRRRHRRRRRALFGPRNRATASGLLRRCEAALRPPSGTAEHRRDALRPEGAQRRPAPPPRRSAVASAWARGSSFGPRRATASFLRRREVPLERLAGCAWPC